MTASRLYLNRFKTIAPELLASSSAVIIAPSYIDPSAIIDPTAKIGPNVAIGPGVRIGEGVRVKDAIVMEGSTIERHACVLNSIVGNNCQVGPWARVDGEPEPEQDSKGKISVTVLGESSSQIADHNETEEPKPVVLGTRTLDKGVLAGRSPSR